MGRWGFQKKKTFFAAVTLLLLCFLSFTFCKNALATGYYNLQAFWQNPAMPPTANLKMWLRPETLNSLSDGAAVSNWPDSSGNGNYAAQGTAVNQPLYRVNQINGKAAVHFDGVDDYMKLFRYNTGTDTNFNSSTLIVVYKPESQVTRTAGNAWGDSNRVISVETSAAADWQNNGFEVDVPFGSDLDGDSWRMLIVAPTTQGGNNYSYGLLGQYVSDLVGTVGTSWPYTGYISEVLVYGAALSSAQIISVQNYLKTKYNLSPPPMWSGGGGDANWTNPLNWIGGTVPGPTDMAVFTTAGCSSNCSPTIDASINVGGVHTYWPYQGTITQGAGANLTLGSHGWAQEGSHFVGGSSSILINGPIGVNGTFKSTSGTMTIGGNFYFWASLFDPNAGTVIFDNATCTSVTGNLNYYNPTINFYNLQYGGNDTSCGGNVIWNIGAGQTFNVQNNFTMGRTGGTALVVANGGTISVGGNVSMTAGANGGTTQILWNGAGAQTYTSTGGGVPPGGAWTVNKATGTLTLASNLSLNTAGQTLTVTNGTVNMAGFTLTVNNALTIADQGTLECNGVGGMTGSYSSSSLSNYGLIDCPNAIYPFNWTGAGGNTNWNTAGNWSGGVAPGTNDIAVFSNSRCGGTCNAATNIDPTARGLVMVGDFTGTITQPAGITISLNKFREDNGTFIGGNSNFTLSGTSSGSFYLNGGTFTSTSGTLAFQRNFVVTGAPVFNHNNGTLQIGLGGNMDGGNITPNSITVNNVYDHGSTGSANGWLGYTTTGILNVAGNYTSDIPATPLSDPHATSLWGTGTFNVRGNVTANGSCGGSTIIAMAGSSNQTLSGNANGLLPSVKIASTGGIVSLSGNIVLMTDWTYTSGTVNAGASTVQFGDYSHYDRSVINSGAMSFNNVYFHQQDAGYSYTPTTVVGTMNVSGNVTFDLNSGVQGTTPMSGGTVAIGGNLIINGGGNMGVAPGTTMFKMVGSGNQTISGNGNGTLPGGIEIASTGGTVTLSGYIMLQSNWIYTSGVVDAGTSLVRMGGWTWSDGGTINSGLMQFYDLVFGGTYDCGNGYTIVGTAYVNHSLQFWVPPTTCASNLWGGTIDVKGDFWYAGNGPYDGSTLIRLTGSGIQTVTGNASSNVPSLEIASTGTVNMSGTVVIENNFTYTSGAVNFGTSTMQFGNGARQQSTGAITGAGLSFNNVTFNARGWYTDTVSGTMNVLGTLNIATTNGTFPAESLCGGTINALGDVTVNGVAGGAGWPTCPGGATNIRIVGGVNQNLSGNGSMGYPILPNLEIASTGGTVNVTSHITVMSNFTYTSGAVNMNTSNIQLGVNDPNESDNDSNIKSGSVTWYDLMSSQGPNGPAGLAFTTRTQTDSANVSHNFNLSSGHHNMAGHNLAVTGTCTINAGTILIKNGGILTCGTLVNNGTINP